MKINKYIVFLCLALCASGAGAQELIGIRTDDSQETITLQVPSTDSYRVFLLQNPDRLVADVPAFPPGQRVVLPSAYRGGLIRAVRFGQFNANASRFVFDLAEPIRVLDVSELKNGEAGLVISIVPQGSKAAAAPKPEKKAKKPVVVIDAGHGGVDPGAQGPKGTFEKNVVLDYAKALKAKLSQSGRYQVKLTREDDEFIKLRDRVEIARKAEGDIFISLHADSAPGISARGLSVYTVSEQASDQEAEMLAQRENKADVIAGMDLSEEREDVAGILISLAQRETKNRSATLADLLVTRLNDKVKLLENAHRFAGFAVLKAPDIPSVLIEVGFLSNPGEEKLLRSKAYRDKVVGGIAAGVEAYFKLQKEMGSE